MEEQIEESSPRPKAKFNRRAALVLDGDVVNMIVVEQDEDGVVEFVLGGHEIVVVEDDSEVSIGWTYSAWDESFTPPPSE